MPRKKKAPFNQRIPNRGLVVAVQLENQLWCYVREYTLSHGFLPFFSMEPLPSDELPTLKAALHFDLWCYDVEETPMLAVGVFPFESAEESYGEPSYITSLVDTFYRIDEIHEGHYRMRTTKDLADVAGIRLKERYEPHQFSQLLRDKMGEWPVLGG